MSPALYREHVVIWTRKQRRLDRRAALVVQAVYNSHGGKGNGFGYTIAELIGDDGEDEQS